MVILNSIELSWQSGSAPDRAPIPSVSRDGPSPPSGKQDSPTRDTSPIDLSLRIGSRSPPRRDLLPAEPSLRERSRSPPPRNVAQPARVSVFNVLGYRLDQLQFIRITPNKNPNRIFKLRMYTFPEDKPILILLRRHSFVPVSTEEQLVLSSMDGEVFAILENNSYFAGIYTYIAQLGTKVRAKINIESGRLDPMNRTEIMESPVGAKRFIYSHYQAMCINPNIAGQ